jgi:hypothetical protein
LEVPNELPASRVGVFYFPPSEKGRGQLYEGVLKFTQPARFVWWGVFAARSRAEMGLNLACTMPNPSFCCISCFGTGYIVNVEQPEGWNSIDLYPVLTVVALTEPQLLLLNSFTRIVAYDSTGLKWRTESLCSDGLNLLGANGNVLECTGWDAATDQEIMRHVDIFSGKVR